MSTVPTTRVRSRVAAAALALPLVLGLAGCGGSDGVGSDGMMGTDRADQARDRGEPAARVVDRRGRRDDWMPGVMMRRLGPCGVGPRELREMRQDMRRDMREALRDRG